MNLDGYAERLPCGARLAELIEQVTEDLEPRDPAHQSICPYCLPALERVREAWRQVRGLADEPVLVPGDLARRVIARIRTQLGSVGLPDQERGRTRVGNRVIARLAREAARSVSDVSFASAVADDGPEGEPVTVRVRLVVAYGPTLAPVAEAVRMRVSEALMRVAGVESARVLISVEDLEESE